MPMFCNKLLSAISYVYIYTPTASELLYRFSVDTMPAVGVLRSAFCTEPNYTSKYLDISLPMGNSNAAKAPNSASASEKGNDISDYFRFYDSELNAILGSDPTSIASCPVDTSQAAERGGNPEAEILDEEVELEEDVELPVGLPREAGSQELLSTPEVFNREQEADEMPDKLLWVVYGFKKWEAEKSVFQNMSAYAATADKLANSLPDFQT
ncbi:hypothetical protein UY3_13937 [Chelonia mydas]|uniref:Uncharacterized protein n=1 Tax=Chelonia mydas TaxID=8469 RepID=M7AW11_CHEMY|nr:hypothetical protein UY3_13937 [Chelonia mydas]